MRRLPSGFYRDLQALRDTFGRTEYDVEDLIKAALPVLDKHLKDGEDALRRDLLRGIIERAEATENDPLQGDFFAHNAHCPLGERRRIKRGRMNLDQVRRRKRVIDTNHERQVHGWVIETRWCNVTEDALRPYPPETVREDVLTEDGKLIPPKAAE